MPLDGAAEARHAAGVEPKYGAVAPEVFQETFVVLFGGVVMSRPGAARPQPGGFGNSHRIWPSRAVTVSLQRGHG